MYPSSCQVHVFSENRNYSTSKASPTTHRCVPIAKPYRLSNVPLTTIMAHVLYLARYSPLAPPHTNTTLTHIHHCHIQSAYNSCALPDPNLCRSNSPQLEPPAPRSDRDSYLAFWCIRSKKLLVSLALAAIVVICAAQCFVLKVVKYGGTCCHQHAGKSRDRR